MKSDDLLTEAAIARLRRTLEELQTVDRPRAVEDLSRAREMGDLSENAAYSEAKGRLMRIDGRVFSIKERLKNAIVIKKGADPEGRVRVGATVVVTVNGNRREYEILGSQETNPSKGRISHQSPVGKALMGKRAGESVAVKAQDREITYKIEEVR